MKSSINVRVENKFDKYAIISIFVYKVLFQKYVLTVSSFLEVSNSLLNVLVYHLPLGFRVPCTVNISDCLLLLVFVCPFNVFYVQNVK